MSNVHTVPKTAMPAPPPPHLTAFAWTVDRGILVPAWTSLAPWRVLVPWDRAVAELRAFARTVVLQDDAHGYATQTTGEDGSISLCFIARWPVRLPTDTRFRRGPA